MTDSWQISSADVDVIIPARNAAGTIARTFRSLAPDRRVIAKVILVDDGSTDDTGATAQAAALEFGLPLEIIRTNCGSAGAARNIGLAKSFHRFVHFLDADDELVAGALAKLRSLLIVQAGAGIATGMVIRRSRWRKDLLKFPHGYSESAAENTRRYLRNGLNPIAMGAAMATRAALGNARFPVAAALDEDTVFWAQLLWANTVATTDEAVLVYHLDLARMERRFTNDPQGEFLRASQAIRSLADLGMPAQWLDWRIAWIALRFARQLIMAGRPREAEAFVSLAKASPDFARSWKVFQYGVRIAAARFLVRRKPSKKTDGPTRPLRRFMIVTHDPVWPPVSGYDHRNWSIATALSKRGKVLLVSVRPIASDKERPAHIELATLAIEGGSPDSSNAGRVERLADIARKWMPDAAVFSGVPLSRLMLASTKFLPTLIVDMQNVESALERALTTIDMEPSGWRSRIRWRKTRQRELQVMAAAAQVWCCSRIDRDRLYALKGPGPDIAIIPNTIPQFGQAPISPYTGPNTVFFGGHLGYLPNRIAAKRLAENIMPLIRHHMPGTRLVLAGRSPAADVLKLADTGFVDVIANPPDMGEHLARAAVSVMPITVGGGTRIKALECMAAKVPVIATGLAVEGLDLRPGVHFLHGESDDDLAKQAVAALRGGTAIAQMREEAFSLAQTAFGQAALAAAIDDALSGID